MPCKHDLVVAKTKLGEAMQLLDGIIKSEGYKVNQMREIRTLLLGTVRNEIDPYALGHAPQERRY